MAAWWVAIPLRPGWVMPLVRCGGEPLTHVHSGSPSSMPLDLTDMRAGRYAYDIKAASLLPQRVAARDGATCSGRGLG